MRQNHLLIDSGWLKYVAIDRAQANLKCVDRIQLSRHPSCFEQMYNIIGRCLQSKMSTAQMILGPLHAVHLCIDDKKSWRTGLTGPLTPDHQDSGIIYKSHRVDQSDEELIKARWQLNVMYMDIVGKISEMNGILIQAIPHIEADDILTLKSKALASLGHACLTASHDYDNTQSVESHESGGFVINMYIGQFRNPDRYFTDHPTHELLQTRTIFGNSLKLPNTGMDILAHAMPHAKQYMLLEKILRGDVSDGVSPLMIRIANTKKMGIAPKAIQVLIDRISDYTASPHLTYEHLYDNDVIEQIVQICHESVFKVQLDLANDIERSWFQFYIDKFKFNRKLVACNANEIGESVVREIDALPNIGPAPQSHVAPYHIVKQLLG